MALEAVVTIEEPEDSPPPGASERSIKFINSVKGKKVLVYGGYVFHVNSTVKTSTYFNCSQKFKGCNARIILKNFNKEDCSYEEFTVSGREHVNHLPNMEKIGRKKHKQNEIPNEVDREIFSNCKHVCLFCLELLPLGYRDITNLENIMPSGHTLSIVLDDPLKNSKGFDLLCILLNVKWRRSQEVQAFDQKKSLPLCFQCQALYQELIQVHQQIQELQRHINTRAKVIRETIQRTEKMRGKKNHADAEKTYLEVLGLNLFRKKVVNPDFNWLGEDKVHEFSVGFSKSPEHSPNSEATRLKDQSMDDSFGHDAPLIVKEEVQEVDQVLSELLEDGDHLWLDDTSADLADTGRNGSGFGSESESKASRESERVFSLHEKRKNTKTYQNDPARSVEEDEGSGFDDGDATYSAVDSVANDDESESDYKVKSVKRIRNSLREFRDSTRRQVTTYKKKAPAFKPKSECTVNTCHICSARIVGHKGFMRHYQVEHPKERRYTCIYCKKYYTHVSKVITHQRNKHTGEKPFECSTCHKKYASGYLLKLHTSSQHSNASYPCPHCDKLFTSKTEHMNHLAAMHGEAPKQLFYRKSRKPMKTFTCHMCDFQVLGAGPFLQHYKDVHPEEKRYSCKFCKRHFPNIRDVLTHQRRHTGEKPFKCKDCNKYFTNEKGLRAHRQYLHTPREKTLQCPHCPKRFALKGNLTAHIESHKEYVVICKACGRSLKSQSSFFKHNRLFHDGKAECTQPVSDPSKETLDSLDLPTDIFFRKKCHVCMAPIPGRALLPKHFAECHPDHPGDFLTCRCGQKFPNYKKVFNHAIRKHPGAEKPYQCEQCPMRFLTIHELRIHANRHIPVEERHKTHICEICGMGLASVNTLAKHMILHQDNQPRHVCEICGKSYAQIKGLQHHHKTEHLKLLPFKCPFEGCGKAYPIKSVLLKHQNIHTGEKSYRCEVCHKNFLYSRSLARHLREVHDVNRGKGKSPRKRKSCKSIAGGSDGESKGKEETLAGFGSEELLSSTDLSTGILLSPEYSGAIQDRPDNEYPHHEQFYGKREAEMLDLKPEQNLQMLKNTGSSSY